MERMEMQAEQDIYARSIDTNSFVYKSRVKKNRFTSIIHISEFQFTFILAMMATKK
jgi:hypothetical protein